VAFRLPDPPSGHERTPSRLQGRRRSACLVQAAEQLEEAVRIVARAAELADHRIPPGGERLPERRVAFAAYSATAFFPATETGMRTWRR